MNTHLLATGIVIDDPASGSFFPSAGGNSSDPRVQAIYWRCAAVLMASARIHNPALPLALFTNLRPPVLDGKDLGELFRQLDVDIRIVAARARLPAAKASMFGNVHYFIDILDSLDALPEAKRLTLLDCDVLVTQPLDATFAQISQYDFAGYRVDSTFDENINGMNRREMTEVAGAFVAVDAAHCIPHFGGEFFSCSLAAWREGRDLFHTLFENACSGSGPGHAIRTEEHLFSIAFACLSARIGEANGLIRRIWTSPRHSDTRPSDLALPMWHLPAEKRYGIADLYRDLAQAGFDDLPPPEEFRRMAKRRVGIPCKSARKFASDGWRQVAAKLGMRV